jgi:protein-disulfide isomerase
MENRMMNDQEWVERRMALLDRDERPAADVNMAFAKLRARDRRFHAVRRNWIWCSAMATVACVVLVALPSKSVCCAREVETPPAEQRAAPVAPQAARPKPVTVAVKPAPVVAEPAPKKAETLTHYKESGSPTAPLACEIYSDFECPACGVFYRETYPQLEAQYVKTGKLKIVHRDFPLPQHPYAQLAAHYADAAGELGQYELVFRRLFETQAEWSANGNIAGVLKPALTAEMLSKIESRLSDQSLDQSIALDKIRGAADQLNQTPTLVIVTPDGQRHKLAGAQPFITLSAYLDELAAAKH